MKIAVVVFPGTNCEHDIIHTYSALLGQDIQYVWYKERDIGKPDVVILPGGFSFGDYLRTGALARVAPIINEIKTLAGKGVPILGVCNGFQILCEVGLLPGVLLANIEMRFISQFVHYKVENTKTPFTAKLKAGEVLTSPIAHFEGNYFADEETLKLLEGNGRVVFRYCGEAGKIDHGSRTCNPNGAMHSIAGICSEKGNVVGLMPHPERAAESRVGYIGADRGRAIFESVLR